MESVNVCVTDEMSVNKQRRPSDFKDRRVGDDRLYGNSKPDEDKLQIEGGEILRHFCKICKRRFACGRALGGHMRIHGEKANPRLIRTEAEINGWGEAAEDGTCTDPSPDKQRHTAPMYGLRTNRKRSWMLADQSCYFLSPFTSGSGDADEDRSSFLFSNSRACDGCGKEFSSWKALLAHIKCTHCSNPQEMESHSVVSRIRQLQPAAKGKRSKRLKFSEEDDPEPQHSQCNEEEDMANCLVMLRKNSSSAGSTKAIRGKKAGSELVDRINSRRARDPCENIGKSKTNGMMYKCNTCDKVFSSFKALGGHRASHDNNWSASSKMGNDSSCSEEEIVTSDEDLFTAEAHNTARIALAVVAAEEENDETLRKARVHECSICERKFASGQALGGHKRCHRTTTTTPTTAVAMSCSTLYHSVEEKRALSLEGDLIDLNLPAPCHDDEYEAEYRDKVAAPNNLVNSLLTDISYF